MPQAVEIPKYTASQRRKDVIGWFFKSCVREIKGYAACFGWDDLMHRVNSDPRELPNKYRVMLELADDYKYSIDNIDFDFI